MCQRVSKEVGTKRTGLPTIWASVHKYPARGRHHQLAIEGKLQQKHHLLRPRPHHYWVWVKVDAIVPFVEVKDCLPQGSRVLNFQIILLTGIGAKGLDDHSWDRER